MSLGTNPDFCHDVILHHDMKKEVTHLYYTHIKSIMPVKREDKICLYQINTTIL